MLGPPPALYRELPGYAFEEAAEGDTCQLLDLRQLRVFREVDREQSRAGQYNDTQLAGHKSYNRGRRVGRAVHHLRAEPLRRRKCVIGAGCRSPFSSIV